MSVTVDAKAIRSQLRKLGDGMLLLARSKPVLPAELVRAAAVAAEAEESTPWMGSVMVIPAGVAIGLEGPEQDVMGFVVKFAAELGSRTDAEVTLGAARNENPPAWVQAGYPGNDSVSAWMVHHPRLPVNGTPWLVDEETTRRLAVAVAHEVELPDATWANIGHDLSLNYAGISIADSAPELVRTNEGIGFDTGQREPQLVYATHFPSPRDCVGLVRPADGWSCGCGGGRAAALARVPRDCRLRRGDHGQSLSQPWALANGGRVGLHAVVAVLGPNCAGCLRGADPGPGAHGADRGSVGLGDESAGW